jgi:3-hydroxyisobutyrate dehydrogenase
MHYARASKDAAMDTQHVQDAPQIGYIGLGAMGAALAARLHRRFPLRVHDVQPEAVQRAVDMGAAACASAQELGAKCDVVALCLPTSDHVRAALWGERGLAAGLRPGSLVIDQTTGDPVATRAMAAQLAAKGIDFVDAPVSGGAAGARAGTIATMVGASDEAYGRVLPLLQAISPNVLRAGAVGAGHVMKLVNNMLSASQRLASMEALALAAKNGIQPQRACEILLAGGAKNAFIEKGMPAILRGDLSPGFTLALMHKDVRLACEMGSGSRVPLFYGSLTSEILQLAISEFGPQGQVNLPALMFDRLAGTQVVPPSSPDAAAARN